MQKNLSPQKLKSFTKFNFKEEFDLKNSVFEDSDFYILMFRTYSSPGLGPVLEILISEQALKVSCGPQPMASVPF